MLVIITLFVCLVLDSKYSVSCNLRQMYNLCTEVENRVLYCFEYHKQVEYSVECAGMCLNHKSPTWDDEFLNSQGVCILFAYNKSSTAEANCKLCLLLNGGEVCQVNTRHIFADYIFLNPNHETGTKMFSRKFVKQIEYLKASLTCKNV